MEISSQPYLCRLNQQLSFQMDNNLESQQEEEEALLAIYDGDPAFKQVSSTVIQYKVSLLLHHFVPFIPSCNIFLPI